MLFLSLSELYSRWVPLFFLFAVFACGHKKRNPSTAVLEVSFVGYPDFFKRFFANVICCSPPRGFSSLFLYVKYLSRSSLE